jgi:endonuclease/exonuclease/phosphatase (EEP) superfamily protein YafD
VRQLEAETGMRGPRWPPATWPVWAGPFGVPIDQLLVRGGVGVVRMKGFGAGLGSNHRGFVADLAIR